MIQNHYEEYKKGNSSTKELKENVCIQDLPEQIQKSVEHTV